MTNLESQQLATEEILRAAQRLVCALGSVETSDRQGAPDEFLDSCAAFDEARFDLMGHVAELAPMMDTTEARSLRHVGLDR